MNHGHGRPLRFLAVLGCSWVGMRTVLLWPTIDSAPALLRAVVPVLAAAPRPPALAAQAEPAVPQDSWSALPVVAGREKARAPAQTRAHPQADPGRVALALLGLVRFGDADDAPAPFLPGVPRTTPATASKRSRWSGSVWLIARGGDGIVPGVAGGQLGGSQAGVRLAYTLDRRHRVALAGRVTSPLGRGLREAAVGIEWQPTRLPVRVVAEQRIALGDGHGGPALGVVGGLDPLALGRGFRLEAYGQAGIIRRAENEPYVDGAARATHPLATIGRAHLSGGAGVWGAAQRGAARLDLGPALTLDLPVAHRPLRFALEYRARVAGDARPGSGLALTLGTDF